MNPNQEKVEEIELKNANDISTKASAPETINNIDGHHPNRNLSDDEQPLCRLCFGTAYDDTDLIEPCSCKGTMAKVHRNCLEKWLTRSGSTKCDLCLFELKCVEKLRYGLFESIGIWYRRRQHRTLLLHDLSIFFTISVIALPVIGILLRHIFTIFMSDRIAHSLPTWYVVVLGITLSMWIVVYFMNGFVIVNAQIRPWYCWWKSKKQIRLAVNS